MALTTKALLDQRFMTRRDKRFPRFSYLGSAAKQPLMDDWINLLKGIKKYVDPVAGSNNQPYAIGSTHNIPVLVNDGSYYSHCIACGLFHRRQKTRLSGLAGTLVKTKKNKHEGIFTTEYAPKTFSKTFTTYVDGFLVLLNEGILEEHAQFARACVGKTLMNLCSFRSVSFSLAPKLRDLKPSQQVEEFASTVLRTAHTMNTYRTPGEAWFGDARRFLKKADLKGATVSFDPAWPFAKERKATNPYHFYRKIGDILHQQVHEEIQFWTNPDSSKAVANEFAGWVRLCFKRGADQVFAWNQDSNLPSKKILMKTLKKEFRVKGIMKIVMDRVTRSGKVFEDYVLHIRAD